MECPGYFDKILKLIISEKSDKSTFRQATKICESLNEGNSRQVDVKILKYILKDFGAK